MTEKETFLSIEEAHQKYDIPGRSNREFIYDKDGMIRIYKVGQKYIDDVIENNNITSFFGHTIKQQFIRPSSYIKFEQSMIKQTPIMYFYRKDKKSPIVNLGTWYVHSISFNHVKLKTYPPTQ